MRFMSGLLQVVFFLVVVSAALLAAGLIANKLPWMDPPGVGTRLMTYLSTNVAETAADSPFPELKPRAYAAPAAFMFDVARRAAKALKWELTNIDPETKKIEAVVTTQVIGFKDDVIIQVEATGEESCKLLVRSASRVGKGDLGANTRHVMNLIETVNVLAPVTAMIVEQVEVQDSAVGSADAADASASVVAADAEASESSPEPDTAATP